MSQRLPYIDVAKGILICLVVLHHMPHVAREVGIDSGVYAALQSTDIIYKAFFMPAFFVITGLCSNFDKELNTFLFSNIKTILVPAFCLGIVSNWIMLMVDGVYNPIEYCKLGFSTFALYGGPFWFLSALFLSKLLYYGILQIGNSPSIRLLLISICLILGVSAHQFSNGGSNYWHYQQAFTLLPFLHIGQYFKIKSPAWFSQVSGKVIAGVAYALLLGVLMVLDLHVPYITNGYNVDLYEIPLFLTLSTLGTIGIIGISQIISNNSVLEYWGRNSLIIYSLHICILRLLFQIGFKNLSHSEMLTLISVPLIWISTICICSLFVKVLNTKYFKFLIGKF